MLVNIHILPFLETLVTDIHFKQMAAARSPCRCFKTRVLHFRLKNTPLKDKKMERESSAEYSAFFWWRKGSFSSRNRPSKNSITSIGQSKHIHVSTPYEFLMRLRIIWTSDPHNTGDQSVRPSGRFIQFICTCVRYMCPRVCPFVLLIHDFGASVRPSNPFDSSFRSVWSVCPSSSSVLPSVHPVCLAVHTVLLSSSSVRSSGCPSVRSVHPVRPFVGPSSLSVCPCFPSVDTCISSPCGFVRLVSLVRPVCVICPSVCLSIRSSKHRW